MRHESRISYSDYIRQKMSENGLPGQAKEVLPTIECKRPKPKILAFMGASGSGKDVAIEILTSLPGRRGIAKKLELDQPVNTRVVRKVTDRPPRYVEVSKDPVSAEEYDAMKASGELFAEYTLQSNGCRYAFKLADFTQACQEDFLIAEPSILHIIELKERFGDQIHCTFLTSSRAYREKLLRKRATESEEEIERRLDEGDGQTYVALLLAGKPVEFINQFVSPTIGEHFQHVLNTDPSLWSEDANFRKLAQRIGPDTVGILEKAVANKGNVVDELINIDRFQTFIDDIVILEDKFITDQPYEAGLFSESVLDSATRMLLNAENRVFSIDQTSDAPIICNMIVPEASKKTDSIFGVPFKKIRDAVRANHEDRTFLITQENGTKKAVVRWVSYYADREQVFGLILTDPENPESVASFTAVKPDASEEALIQFQIQLPSIRRETDRHIAQMAFMSQALKVCEMLGVRKFHYAEHFDLVDEQDNVIGIVPRSIAHEDGRFIHRAASVLLWRWRFDEQKGTQVKQLLMVKRSRNKQMNPNVWQAAPSGHVLPGETYAEAARREMREEIGAEFAERVDSIHPLMSVRNYPADARPHTAQRENFFFFMAHVDPDTSERIKGNYEVSALQWMDVDAVKEQMEQHPEEFRDAFRIAFRAIDWDTMAVRNPKHAAVV